MACRISISIAAFFGSIIAAVLWLFFYADKFSGFQDPAILIVIGLAFVGVMGAVWDPWGMKWAVGAGKTALANERTRQRQVLLCIQGMRLIF